MVAQWDDSVFPRILMDIGDQLWLVWELLLLNEPLLVISSNPSVSSAAVMFLTQLIAPLEYAADFRPNVIVQDADFDQILGQANIIAGTTCPLIENSIQRWPNVVWIDREPSMEPPVKIKSPIAVKALNALKIDYTLTVFSRQERVFARDKEVLKTVRDHTATAYGTRRYFWEQTRSFLRPLEQFLEHLQTDSFDKDAFRRFIQRGVLCLKTRRFIKTAAYGFYERFVETKNFRAWHQSIVGRKKRAKDLSAMTSILSRAAATGQSDIGRLEEMYTLQSLVESFEWRASDGELKQRCGRRLAELRAAVNDGRPHD